MTFGRHYCSLFHDLCSAPIFHHSVWSVITAHKLTPAKHDVTAVVSDQCHSTVALHCTEYRQF